MLGLVLGDAERRAGRGDAPLDLDGSVARRVVRSLEGSARIERLYVPYIFKWLPVLLMLLPAGLRDVALDIAGAETAMQSFRGRE